MWNRVSWERIPMHRYSEGGAELYANNSFLSYQTFLYCNILSPKDCPTVLEPSYSWASLTAFWISLLPAGSGLCWPAEMCGMGRIPDMSWSTQTA